MELVKDIIDTVDFLYTQKSVLMSEFQNVVDYVLPDRANVNRYESPGTRRGVTRYDDTAVDACEVLSGNFAATLTPMGSVWMDLAIENAKVNAMKKVKQWCQECRDLMLAKMAQSNFYLAMDELYLDMCGFGTSTIYGEMVGQRLSYNTWAAREYVFTMGIDGRVECLYRKFKMSPAQMKTRFEKHPGFKQLGTKVTERLGENAKAEDRNGIDVEVIHAICPRDSYVQGSRFGESKPIASLYINVTDRCVIAEGGYDEMPANVARFRVASDDDMGWGRGPGTKVIASVMSLNAAAKMGMKTMAKDLDPPLVVEDKGVIGSVRTVPNGITYVRRDARFEYLTSGAKPGNAEFWVARLENQIRQAFYADHLRLPPPQGTPMTATETQIRWELMERLLGPTLGRLTQELLNPVIERTFGLMMRAGMLPQPPQEVLDQNLKVVYTGPLAKAQQMPDIVAIERTYQTAANIATLSGDTSGLKRLSADKATQRVAELYGFPANAMLDDDEHDQLMQQEMQARQGMEERQDAMMAADIAQKSGKVMPIGRAA